MQIFQKFVFVFISQRFLRIGDTEIFFYNCVELKAVMMKQNLLACVLFYCCSKLIFNCYLFVCS